MDQSFDQFGGGGWGEHGEGEQQQHEYSGFQHKKSIYNKVLMQVEIDDLLKMSSDEENFLIGKYSFNMIRVVGKIVNIHNDPNQTTPTYEVCDALAKDPRTAKRLTVIVINQGETENKQRENSKPPCSEGQTIHIVGKIKAYNNRVSLISIHIRDIAMDEIELFKMECKLAKYFYQKNLPEQPPQALENTIFKILPTQQQQARPGTGTGKPTATPSRAGYSNAPTPTPNRSNSNMQAQTPSINYGKMPQHLTAQQKQIYGFIVRFAESNSGGSGVHIEQIRASIKPNDNFRDDLQFLQNDGKIYTTVDDDHYSIVE